MSVIPEEVRSAVRWADTPVADNRIRFFKKSEISKSEAWGKCPLPTYPGGIPKKYNPWRKAHSMNYWVWFCTEDVPRKDS